VAEGRIELGPFVISDFDEKVLPTYRCTGKGHQFSWNLSESLSCIRDTFFISFRVLI
jgi:hypothetical protein